jgi:hypothetical protein
MANVLETKPFPIACNDSGAQSDESGTSRDESAEGRDESAAGASRQHRPRPPLTNLKLQPERSMPTGNCSRPDDTDWTGAEITSCCRLASLLDVPLVQAPQNVVPVTVTAGDKIESLRRLGIQNRQPRPESTKYDAASRVRPQPMRQPISRLGVIMKCVPGPTNGRTLSSSRPSLQLPKHSA